MRKKFAFGAIFLMSYLGFLIATVPATLLLGQIELPKNIAIVGVQGSIWSTRVDQISFGKASVEKLTTSLSFWSLFTLTPKVAISFGDPFSSGPEGSFVLAASQQQVEITELILLVKANDIAQQLTLPLPVSALGDVELLIVKAVINIQDKNACLTVDGQVTWSKAGVIALEQNIKLGSLNAEVGCENGAFAVILSQKNDLGLTFNAYVREGGRISGNGFLQPGENFPKTLNSALPFLGEKDNQGRYRLSF